MTDSTTNTQGDAENFSGSILGKITWWCMFAVVGTLVVLIGIAGLPKLLSLLPTGSSSPAYALVYPDSSSYNPRPSVVHDTWGPVVLSVDTSVTNDANRVAQLMRIYQGKFLPAPFARLAHPTIIWQSTRDTNKYYVSIDGTNEAGYANPRATHTTEGKIGRKVLPGKIVNISLGSGRIHGALGRPMPDHVGWQVSPFAVHEKYRINDVGDGYYREVLLFRLRSKSGKITPWKKFCYQYSFQVLQCGDIQLLNSLGEEADIDAMYNGVYLAETHLTGKSEPELVHGDMLVGYDGARRGFSFTFVN